MEEPSDSEKRGVREISSTGILIAPDSWRDIRVRPKARDNKVKHKRLEYAEILEEESVFIEDSPGTSGKGRSRSKEESARRDLPQCFECKTIENWLMYLCKR